MIKGTITLEDLTIDFRQLDDSMDVCYCVHTEHFAEIEVKTVNGPAFFKALAIAVHNDGMPDYHTDYESAESVQPTNDLRAGS